MLTQTHHRSAWIDDARVIATLAVIIVHVATPGVVNDYKTAVDLSSGWSIANAYDSISRFCVPVFVMLTGALLVPQTISFTDFINRRVKRLLIPFLFWSVVYLGFHLALKVRDEGIIALSHSGYWILTQFVQGSSPHLWYVYMIVGVYLFIPIIRPWATAAGNKAILFFLALWVITLFMTQQQLISISSPLDLRYFSGYVGYMLLGYYITDRLLITRYIQYLAIALFFGGFIITFLATKSYTINSPLLYQGFYEYLTINVAMEAAGIFILIKSFSTRQFLAGFFNPIRTVISRYGYGIYLAHLLVLSIMAHFKIDGHLITPLIGIPLSAFICLFITALIIYLLNKLPYGKYFIG